MTDESRTKKPEHISEALKRAFGIFSKPLKKLTEEEVTEKVEKSLTCENVAKARRQILENFLKNGTPAIAGLAALQIVAQEVEETLIECFGFPDDFHMELKGFECEHVTEEEHEWN